MTDHEHAAAKAIGLDIGTSRIVMAQRQKKDFQFQSQLNAFVTLPFSKLTQNLFQKENIPHSVEGSELVVYGNESEKLANMFHSETRRPMTRGVLNPSEPDSIVLIQRIVASMLGEGPREGRKVVVSVPAPPLGWAKLSAPDDLIYHEATLRQSLAQFGLEVSTIQEGLAVVLSELESSNYTGIGISCGGGMCNICLAYLSVPVLSFSIPKAGDFIDAGAASVTGEGPTRIRAIKEQSFHFNGHFADKAKQALGVYYDEVIQTIASALKEAFSPPKIVPRLDRPIPLVLAGGSAMPAGFRDRFEQVLKQQDLPVPLSEIRLAADPLHATAKGALVAALADL